jgi:hypothetical protein
MRPRDGTYISVGRDRQRNPISITLWKPQSSWPMQLMVKTQISS